MPTLESGEQTAPTRAHLNGNLARRKFCTTGIIWDHDLPGFALRHTARGAKYWLVQYRHRGEVRRDSLGTVEALPVRDARAQARRLLARVALDGLPTKPQRLGRGPAITMSDYLPIFFSHYARRWKPSTLRSVQNYSRNHIAPTFGDRPIADLTRADIVQWRDSLARRPAIFNRAIPSLSVMLGYAETLGYRPTGSNPCKGMPRYKRPLKERYLSAREFQRLGTVLRDNAETYPLSTAALWLLLYTGARKSEIVGLRWEWIGDRFIDLPDSKTGPKRLYLNQQAVAVLADMGREEAGAVFGGGFRCHRLDAEWSIIRAAADLKDVRLHDLRHSFASVAILHGLSLTKLGGLLGHALPETTARYAHLSDDSVQEAANRVSGSMALALGLSS